MSRKIAITELDKQRLEKLINDIIQQNLNGREHIRILRNELNNADIISSKQIPSDIITMNSEVLLSVGDTGEEKVYSLVYPENADFLNNKISVLAPIGTAILGYKEGDEIDWEVPNGITKIKVKKILYQPESTGDFDL